MRKAVHADERGTTSRKTLLGNKFLVDRNSQWTSCWLYWTHAAIISSCHSKYYWVACHIFCKGKLNHLREGSCLTIGRFLFIWILNWKPISYLILLWFQDSLLLYWGRLFTGFGVGVISFAVSKNFLTRSGKG